MTAPTCLVVAFTVHGRPTTQGSKRLVGKVMLESSTRNNDWRAQVSLFAQQAMTTSPTSKFVNLAAVFCFPRPVSHYGTGKNSDKLKPNAPAYPRQMDLDKLVRSVGDAMTGIVYLDDVQVVSLDGTRKVWAERSAMPGGVEITVTEIEGSE